MTSSGRRTRPSKRLRLCAIGLAGLSTLAFTVACSTQAQQASTATPTASRNQVVAAAAPAPYVDSTAILPNPERGLFDHNGTCDANAFDPSRIIRLRREKNITLVRCIFYLEGYQNKDLDQAVFTKLNLTQDSCGDADGDGAVPAPRWALIEYAPAVPPDTWSRSANQCWPSRCW
jgi:hypothetical protein